jgi:hypothetical protein
MRVQSRAQRVDAISVMSNAKNIQRSGKEKKK